MAVKKEFTTEFKLFLSVRKVSLKIELMITSSYFNSNVMGLSKQSSSTLMFKRWRDQGELMKLHMKL